jgi:hypothetical protein
VRGTFLSLVLSLVWRSLLGFFPGGFVFGSKTLESAVERKENPPLVWRGAEAGKKTTKFTRWVFSPPEKT